MACVVIYSSRRLAFGRSVVFGQVALYSLDVYYICSLRNSDNQDI